jgi:hypothetical protein
MGIFVEELGQGHTFSDRGEGNTLPQRSREDTIRRENRGKFHFRGRTRDFPGYLSTSVIKENGRVTGIVIVVADLTAL